MLKTNLIAFISIVAISMTACAQEAAKESKTSVELGTIQWSRDMEQAQAKSKKSGKPLFVQFQEVPG